MRETFEEQLHEYNAVLSDLLDDGNTEDDTRRLEAELKRDVKRAAHEADTTPELERGIVDLQRRKLEVMDRLHAELRAIDRPEEAEEQFEGSRPVSAEGGGLMVEAENGKLVPLTHGELLTDAEWGVAYTLDDSVPRELRKRYAVEHARAELRPLLDEQIMLEEGGSNRTHYLKRDTYQLIHGRRERGELPAGIIAEKMVRNVLKKLSIDTEVDFTVLDSDVYQDVEQKIDFIIKRKAHHRGVKVDADEHAERVGVQMTTSTLPERLAKKHEQVERSKHQLRSADEVDDIVLVSIPLANTMQLYRTWQANRMPGGPDKLWDVATRETIFRDVLAGVFTPEELDEEWGRVQERQLVTAA